MVASRAAAPMGSLQLAVKRRQAVALITVAMAVAHLRLPSTYGSPEESPQEAPLDLRMKMDQAEALILDYLKVSLTSPPDWDVAAGTVPRLVQCAVLCQLGELWRFRGDDPGSIESAPAYEEGQLSKQVTNYLRRWRDPAYA